MSARKIRMTAVGLVSMPAAYDEQTVTADDLVRDHDLALAYVELYVIEQQAAERGWTVGQWQAAEAVDGAWAKALDAALTNDAEAVRRALVQARDVAARAGFTTEHEDAALSMLPDAARRAA